MSFQFQSDICPAERLRPEASFDSGYSTSPSRFLSALTPDVVTDCSSQTAPAMDNRTYLRSPYKGGMQPGLGDEFSIINALTSEPVSLSPFKESSLSPFKLISQSPSKGSFEEWDKDFLAGFEEKLFGMGDLNEIAVEELLKSPQGKMYLNRKNSPLRIGSNHGAVRRLKISPDSKRPGQTFQPLHMITAHNINIGQSVNQEMFDSSTIKIEQLEDTHLYGNTEMVSNDTGIINSFQGQTDSDMFGQSQSMVYMNALSAVDPNKMGATPVKPRYTNVGAPKRRLAMKAPVSMQPMQAMQLQKENQVPLIPVQQIEQMWPSKEKLKYARSKFQEVLNKAVENELELLRTERAKKKKIEASKARLGVSGEQNPKVDKASIPRPGKGKGGGKGGKGISVKSKGKIGKSKRTSKKERYSEVRTALAKTGKVKRVTQHLEHQLYPTVKRRKNDDPGWYPDDEEDEDEDQNWDEPPAFFRQSSQGFYVQGDESEDEYVDVGQDSLYHYEALVGNPSLKRRRVY